MATDFSRIHAATDLTQAEHARDVSELSADRDEWKRKYEELLSQQPQPEPEPEPAAMPMVVGCAFAPSEKTDQYITSFEQRGGNLSGLRSYDSGSRDKPVTEYNWYPWFRKNFRDYLFHSFDYGNTGYGAMADGNYDEGIKRFLAGWPSGVKGTVILGNEMNKPDKNVNKTEFKAAFKHLIEDFTYPALVFPSLAFTNYDAWTKAGSGDGESWLPDTDEFYFVETHFYGKSGTPAPSNALGQMFLPAMRERGLGWGIGETSKKEGPATDSKGVWFGDCAKYVSDQGGSCYLLFDSGTGGSDKILSSNRTAELVKQFTTTPYINNNWT